MKIKLKKIDLENWRFVLYETENKDWIGSFVYSPVSFVDLSMLIILSPEEKNKAEIDRTFLIELSENIRNNYKEFLTRIENKNKFIIE